MEPLGHVLRNAIVHGIEPSDARDELGKPLAGRLTLDVSRAGERLQPDVEDDGAGVRAESVLGRARHRGVLPESGGEITDDEGLQLLCRPGMSSREEVDQLSGRGVGLSAARSAVLDLGGSLVLRSHAGAVFGVRIVVPARVALVNAFIARVDGCVFAIPVDAVQEVARAGTTRTATEIDLAQLFGMPEASVARAETPGPADLALVLTGAGCGARLAVVDVLGPRELVVRPLGAPLDASGLPWAGAALLPEGGLALVLDVARLPRRSV